MFEKARITLTAWYLLIIMAISLAFSLVVFKSITFELTRARERQEKRMVIRPVDQPRMPLFEDEIFEEIQLRVRNTLVLINLAILIGAGGLGYYLAGKTLSPIAQMLDIQTRFISDASHELKTPLTAMRLALEVQLREKMLDPKNTKVVLRDNLEEVIKLQKLTEGLLELSKKPSKNDYIITTLSSIIESAVADVLPLADIKSITIKVSKATDIMIRANSMRLQRAIVAIIENGIKYSPAKSIIKITTSRKGSRIETVIRDYGVGIDPKDLPYLTDRFYRGDTSRHSEGYGLGLSIAKETMSQHGGDLEISPALRGKGTRVELTLPYSGSIQK